MATITKNVHIKMPIADIGDAFLSGQKRVITIYQNGSIIIGFDSSTLTNFKSLIDINFGWDSTPLLYFVSVRYYDTSDNIVMGGNDGLTLTQFQSELSLFFNTNVEWYMKTLFSSNDLDDFLDDLEYYHMYDPYENFMVKYLTNSPKNQVIKDLVTIGVESIEFTRPITNQKITVDRQTLINESRFNYVYISVLNRYYFVDDMTMTNKMCSISLSEDVLMSFSDLIYKQTAYIKRNEFTYDADIIDDRRTYKNESTYSYEELDDTIFDVTSTGTQVFPPYQDRDLRFVITVVGKS